MVFIGTVVHFALTLHIYRGGKHAAALNNRNSVKQYIAYDSLLPSITAIVSMVTITHHKPVKLLTTLNNKIRQNLCDVQLNNKYGKLSFKLLILTNTQLCL